MEAIAALGLACNVLQLVETSLKVVSAFKQAYQHDSTKEQLDASRLCENMFSAVDELQRSMRQPLGRDDSELTDIAQQCLAKASKLQDVLNSSVPSSTRRRDKIKRSIKAVHVSFSSEFRKIELELQTLQRDLDTRTLVSLRSRYDLLLAQQDVAFTSLRSDVQAFVRQQTLLQIQEHQQTRTMIQETKSLLSQQMSSIRLADEIQKQRGKLLDSLSFSGMNARKAAITAAHPETFEWLFNPEKFDS